MATVSVTKEAGNLAVVTLAKEPVNSMDLAFWQELLKTFEGLESDPEVRAVVFRSGLRRSVFTAGLDLRELYAPTTSEERLNEFWRTLTTALSKIYSSSMVTVAAINGACPAGGCGLALCCDYRVISADGSIGLNEVQLGIPVPQFWVELFTRTVGQRQAEMLLQTGQLVPSAHAVQLGLVDAVVASGEEVLPTAVAEVERWLKNPDVGRTSTKQVMRSEFAGRWAAGIPEEAGKVWATISDKRTVALLGKVMQRLSGGKAGSGDGQKAAKL